MEYKDKKIRIVRKQKDGITLRVRVMKLNSHGKNLMLVIILLITFMLL